MRKTRVGHSVNAGCFQCWGSDAHWTGKNAQGVAARHHDATGHQTWADVYMTVKYGDEPTP
jgi:hypothetical protein